MERFVSYDKAAEMLGLSRESIRLYVRRGILTQGDVFGSRKVLLSSVNALLERDCDILQQTKAIEELRAEISQEKKELTAHRNKMDAQKELLKIKTGLYDNFQHICHFLLIFVENTDNYSWREKEMVMRFLRGSSLDELAEEFGLTRERTRQVYERAVRKANLIATKFPRLIKENEELRIEKAELLNKVSALKSAIKNEEMIEQVDAMIYLPETLTKRVEDLFSVRTYNVLKLADIKYPYQLTFFKRGHIMRFRNFGRKSMDELDRFMDLFNIEFDNHNSLKNAFNRRKDPMVAIPSLRIQDELIKLTKDIR